MGLAATAVVTEAQSNILPLRRRAANSTAIPLTSALYGTIFDVEVKFGNQTFLLLFDTGSSDTWVVQTGFQCINATDGTQIPQSSCAYADTYDISPTFEQIADENFGVQYGTGIATGITGYEDITLGGITVKRQQVGVVNTAINPGDGIDSGIIGFGYPALTSAHPGSMVSNDSQLLDRITYTPLFNSMYEQGLVEPYFSLAIERTPYNSSTAPGGYLALGSLPPVSHSPDFAIAPVEITETIPLSFTNGTRRITEWTLSISETVFGVGGSGNRTLTTNSTSFQTVVDSGQPLNLVPAELALAINAQFDPPAVLNDGGTGIFSVQCNATAPTLGFVIGNRTFYHDGRDLIVPLGGDQCQSGVAATIPEEGIALNFLGDVFLKNVVAVFDFGTDEMRFAARVADDARGGNGSVATGAPTAAMGVSSIGAAYAVPSMGVVMAFVCALWVL